MDYTKILNAVADFARGGTSFVYILAVGVGIILVLNAIYAIITKGLGPQAQSSALPWGGIVGRLLIGSLLVTMGWTLKTVFETTGSPTDLQSALAYVESSDAGKGEVAKAMWGAIRAWCVFLGTAGFMRGFLILNRASAGGREMGDDIWRALWHILGGALTIQIFS